MGNTERNIDFFEEYLRCKMMIDYFKLFFSESEIAKIIFTPLENKIFDVGDCEYVKDNENRYGPYDELGEDGLPLKRVVAGKDMSDYDKITYSIIKTAVLTGKNTENSIHNTEKLPENNQKLNVPLITEGKRGMYSGNSYRTKAHHLKKYIDDCTKKLEKDVEVLRNTRELVWTNAFCIDKLQLSLDPKLINKKALEYAACRKSILKHLNGNYQEYIHVYFNSQIVHIMLQRELFNPYERFNTQVARILNLMREAGYINYRREIPKSLKMKGLKITELELAFDIIGKYPFKLLNPDNLNNPYPRTIYTKDYFDDGVKEQKSMIIIYNKKEKEGYIMDEDLTRFEIKITGKYLRNLKGLLGMKDLMDLLNRSPIQVYIVLFPAVLRILLRLIKPGDIAADFEQIKRESKPLYYLISALKFAEM